MKANASARSRGKEDLGLIHRFEPGSSGDTILVLHGTGGDERDLIPLGCQIAPHANLLSPRGQELENGMPRFFRRVAMGVFDEANLVQRAGERRGPCRTPPSRSGNR